jgi:hypothetical protein
MKYEYAALVKCYFQRRRRRNEILREKPSQCQYDLCKYHMELPKIRSRPPR